MSADTEQDRVLQQKESNTAILTLNRPDKKNAITRAMYLNLVDALREAPIENFPSLLLLPFMAMPLALVQRFYCTQIFVTRVLMHYFHCRL